MGWLRLWRIRDLWWLRLWLRLLLSLWLRLWLWRRLRQGLWSLLTNSPVSGSLGIF